MTAETADLTTSQRVVRQYYETTSSRESFTPAMMERQIVTLERLLGDWAPQEGEVVVDLGSGMGETCAAAVARGAASVTGINLSASENELARSIVPQATFVEADIVAGLAALPDASVDRITALNILEHLDKQVLAATLDQAMRVLKPGGSLIAMTPNAGSPFGAMTRYWDITHELAFTPSAFIQIGRLCGFSRFDFRECGPRPHGVVSAIRYVLWQAIRLGIKIRLMIELASTKGGIYTADMLTRLTK
ncbi:class I SAM-dependent methyltransferase [Sphingomonas sp.]|jgi:SAM-dependent methyltransferase|uniref:class I SAM-dependent methyltransferase n=1 Tax=Sphingomonas sp. TaxID=28214 RepID=UPI002E2FC6A4|nr:class I SAM-dependent methyltransferase [Sphingomonas sp.]HEX4695918.1 class I SAM-dependent methyltransferase [Sphingomonas sp.]